ncbi:hypothetical protein B0T18DRAFT_59057 [Schizothecium vesticola]|uniref:Uncharacterized protein n=1 Tax=Schizothecium vesticola TaxID=314040 RepID=A0AA40F4V1_9PEZI|nr:hypothetical protein B0T18DRAFT_59057 [Schizothecium vesticola]
MLLFHLCLRCLLLVPRPRAAPIKDFRKQHVRDPDHGGETVIGVVLKCGGPAGSPSLRTRAHPAFATSLPLLSLLTTELATSLSLYLARRQSCPSAHPPDDSDFSSYIPSYPNPVPIRASLVSSPAPLNSDSSWLTPIVPLDLPHGVAPLSPPSRPIPPVVILVLRPSVCYPTSSSHSHPTLSPSSHQDGALRYR